MKERLSITFHRIDVQFAILMLQLVVYWLSVIYSPESRDPVAYQRF